MGSIQSSKQLLHLFLMASGDRACKRRERADVEVVLDLKEVVGSND